MMRSSVKDLQEQNFYRWGQTSYENQDSDSFGVLEEGIDIKENEVIDREVSYDEYLGIE